MDFRILGPLEVESDGRPIEIAGQQPRALLAVLLLDANRVVSRDRLIESLWGEHAPRRGANTLQVYVSQLRKALGADRLVTRAPGYLLVVEPGELDAQRFEQALESAREAEPRQRRELLRGALALWRGPALAEFEHADFAQAEIRRLEELRLAAIEERISAELVLGRHAELVGELEQLVREHPTRERLWEELMLALYRSGRQSEALQAYQRARRTLVDELGIEPGPALRDLERAILSQAPELAAPPAPVHAVSRGRRRYVWAAAAAALAAAGAAVGLLLTGGGSASTAVVVPNSLVKIDPRTNRVVDSIRVGRRPMLAAAAGRYVWVSNVGDATVSRVDVGSGRVDSVGLPVDIPGGVVDGGDGTVWVGSAYKGTVVQVDAKTLAVRDRVELGGRSAEILAVGGGSLWVTEPNPSGQPFPPESLVRLNLATDAVQRRFPIRVPNMVRYGRGAIWVGNFVDGELTEIDVGTNRMTRARVCSEPSDQVVAFGSVWIACVSDGVWRLDPVSLRPTAVLPMGKAVTFAVAAGAGSIWVSNREAGTVTRIDPRTSRVVARIKVGHFTHGLAFAGGAVWVTVAGVKLPADSFNS